MIESDRRLFEYVSAVQVGEMIRRYASGLLFYLTSLFAGQVMADPGVLDRITVSPEGDSSVIRVQFTLPVRYIAHTVNKAGTEVGVQLQIVQAAAQEKADLVSRDRLSWKSSQTVPLSSVEYQGTGLGTANLLLLFDAPVDGFRVREGRDFHVLEFLINQLPQQSGSATGQPAVSSLQLRNPLQHSCCSSLMTNNTRPRIELSGERISPLFKKAAV